MKPIWFLEDVYLINTIFLKVNFLYTRRQQKAKKRASPWKSLGYPKKPTCRSSPRELYPEDIEECVCHNLAGQISLDS